MKQVILNKVNTKSPNYRKFAALVDDEDYGKINQFNWYAFKEKHTLYAATHIQNKLIFMHNFIMGFKDVDHINGNGLDNQRYNLRKATNQQNCMNRQSRRNSSSKFKGITWYKPTKKWKAQIVLNNEHIHLGMFNSEIEAAKAYNQKAKELFGEFARLNII